MNLMRTDPLSFFSFYKIWKNCLMVLYILLHNEEVVRVNANSMHSGAIIRSNFYTDEEERRSWKKFIR